MEMPVYENLDQMNYRDLMRIAFEIGLITETNIWFLFEKLEIKQVMPMMNIKPRLFLK